MMYSYFFRDLAARNILVFSKDRVKISDFGLSRALGVGKDYYQTNYNVNLKLPVAWLVPQIYLVSYIQVNCYYTSDYTLKTLYAMDMLL